MNTLLILLGKLLSTISRFLNVGSGSTWPGHIAISLNPHFIRDILKTNDQRLKTILVAGTNGKTTTGKLIQTILEKANYRVFQNESGANLLNGIASSLLLHSTVLSKINYDYAILEVDEAVLPLSLKEIAPDYLILLNLFRDQLDRYGEVNTIASKWRDTIQHLLPKTKLILNADDPQIANLSKSRGVLSSTPSRWNRIDASVFYFGLNDKTLSRTFDQHAVDSTYCPNCNSKLNYYSVYYSHLGDWECKNCKLKRPNLNLSDTEYYPVSGTYNRYNTLAAALLAKQIGIKQKNIDSALHEFTPAFGRQEILNVNGKKTQIFLSKNPTSFNESLRTIKSLGAKQILIVLNDRIPDGRDVSWIWDVDFEEIANLRRMEIHVSGDRVYDLALRLKYAGFSLSETQIHADLKSSISAALKGAPKNETLYILPTYSAMLETRKVLTGKKIL